MTSRRLPPPALWWSGFVAAVSGTAALAFPYLLGLTEAAAALAALAWLPSAFERADHPARHGSRFGPALGLGLILGSWGSFFAAPAPYLRLATVALGGAALLLGQTDRLDRWGST
jgi:hypothetical protein